MEGRAPPAAAPAARRPAARRPPPRRPGQEAGADDRFRYLFEEPPADLAALTPWLESAARSTDPLFFAVIDRDTGRAEGRQSLMRIEPAHGVIEIGHILWGPAVARTRVATEALYLFASYVFDALGYRRFEWKCHNLNGLPQARRPALWLHLRGRIPPSHGRQRAECRPDTAWFAMTDEDWPRLKAGYEAWLRPENFGPDKQQKSKLTF